MTYPEITEAMIDAGYRVLIESGDPRQVVTDIYRAMASARRPATVTVPRWALDYVMTHADFQDDGPSPEGWLSPEMDRAVAALNGE